MEGRGDCCEGARWLYGSRESISPAKGGELRESKYFFTDRSYFSVGERKVRSIDRAARGVGRVVGMLLSSPFLSLSLSRVATAAAQGVKWLHGSRESISPATRLRVEREKVR